MSGPPAGFRIGHWTDSQARTGCTAVIAPPGSRGGVDVRGGGPATREIEVVRPLAGTPEATAVMLSGGSAYGLAAADGAARWLEQHGLGYRTPAGLVPIVPAAAIYDLAAGDPAIRPTSESGYAACEAADAGTPERGPVGAGSGAAVGKLFGRERATPGGIGFASLRSGRGEVVAALAVANAFGDVLGEDGSVLAGPRGQNGQMLSTEAELAQISAPPRWTGIDEHNTTLACVMTDAALSKAGCTRVAQMASAGVARAVAPVFSDADGDVIFCLAAGQGEADRFASIAIGALAATATATAIRDAVRP